MKNENNMELYMQNNGFKTIRAYKEYTKDSWTVRILGDEIEAFQDLRDHKYTRYVCLPNTEENLFRIVETINDLKD